MTRFLERIGLQHKPMTGEKGGLVKETIDLKHAIEALSENVRELVHAVKDSNDNQNPSRNPIQDMARGRYKGIHDESR